MSEEPDEDALAQVPADDPPEQAGGGLDDAPDELDEAGDAGEDEVGTAPGGTGHPAVDEVLRSLDALDGRPVDDHVAAFEQAHEQLRRTLSGAGDDTP